MMLDGFDIRFSEMEDLALLKRLFEIPGFCDPFPFEGLEAEEALKNWIGFSKFKASLTGTVNGVPCALGTLFLMPYKKIAHHSSFYLVVDPAYQGKGIGTSMVKNLLNLAKTRFRLESVHVEIYEPNRLLSILSKLGFKEFARQEKFVKMDDGEYRARVLLEHFF